MSQNLEGLNYQWNTQYHNTPATTSQCIPFRFVLKGVRIHCNSNAQSTFAVFNDFDNFFTNEGSEINIFFSDVLDDYNGFSDLNYFGAVVENFEPGLLNHEIGHALHLEHTFWDLGDWCGDTWDFNWNWDFDCNGIPDYYDTNCWDGDPRVRTLDTNGDGIINEDDDTQDACDLEIFCAQHLCCEWSAQNNNLMAYCAWANNPDYSALTPCQITRMLTNLATYKCNFIKVGGCPPPSAFAGTLPSPPMTEQCNSCFYLNASYNESGYEIDILGSDGAEIVSTGVINGTAGKYCITSRFDR
jgi:hypothetical protein